MLLKMTNLLLLFLHSLDTDLLASRARWFAEDAILYLLDQSCFILIFKVALTRISFVVIPVDSSSMTRFTQLTNAWKICKIIKLCSKKRLISKEFLYLILIIGPLSVKVVKNHSNLIKIWFIPLNVNLAQSFSVMNAKFRNLSDARFAISQLAVKTAL